MENGRGKKRVNNETGVRRKKGSEAEKSKDDFRER